MLHLTLYSLHSLHGLSVTQWIILSHDFVNIVQCQNKEMNFIEFGVYQALPGIPDSFLALSVARNEDSNLSLKIDVLCQELDKERDVNGNKKFKLF